MAGREEVLKISPRDPQTVLGQITVDFGRVRGTRMRAQEPLLLVCSGREHAVETDEGLAAGIPDPPVRDIRESGRCQEQGRYWTGAGTVTVSQAQVEKTVGCMCSLSLYAVEEGLCQGFITIQGEHRVGVADRTMALGQGIRLMKSISFINIRVAHQVQGCTNQVMEYLYSDDGRFLNTLVISSSGCGKTTLLRDITRQVSGGPRTQRAGRRIPGVPVRMVDEWSELGVCYQGVPQNDLGTRTDILDCYPRNQGMMMLVRSVAPQVVAVNEIGSREDVQAVEYVRSCGCSLAAAIHGSSLEDIIQKSAVGKLIHQGTFERIVLLDCRGAAGRAASIWDGDGNVLYADGSIREVGHGNI